MGVLDVGINAIHLSVATTDQKYPLGFIHQEFINGTVSSINKYIYIKAISTQVANGGVYAVTRSTSADYTATVPAATDVNVHYGVGLYTIAINSYGFIQIQGNVAALNCNGTITTAHAIAPTVGAATGTDEGAATISGLTIAIATSTSATAVKAFLLGNQVGGASGSMSLGSWQIRPNGTSLLFEYSTDNFATVAWANAFIAE